MVISRTQTPKRRTSRKSKSGRILQIKTGSPNEIQAMSSMIQAGPLTVVLVFRPSCPHCVTYKPIWEDLCKVKGRTANMISVESDNYEKTPLASKKQVTGVPTVLYVNSKGQITEAPRSRDKTHMTEVVRSSNINPPPAVIPSLVVPNRPRTSSEFLSPVNVLESNPITPGPSSPDMLLRASDVAAATPPSSVIPMQPVQLSPASPLRPTISSNMFKVTPLPLTDHPATELVNAVIPGTMVRQSELPVRPGTPIPSVTGSVNGSVNGSVLTGGSYESTSQRGGDAWSALIYAAQQAAPAAALLGAYAALPTLRSSGLGPAIPSKKTRRAKKMTGRRTRNKTE